MNDVLKNAKGNGQMFYRNSQVLWRSNDDETVLLLNSTTGNAYLLCPAMSKVWIALENGITEAQVNEFALTSDESFMATITDLLDKGLINLVSEESALIESGNSLQGISGPYVIDEIAFGGCDCTDQTGNRFGKRQVGCNIAGTLRENVSIV